MFAMKKLNLISALLLGALLAFSSCSGEPSAESTPETTAPETEPQVNEEDACSYIAPNCSIENGVITSAKVAADSDAPVLCPVMYDNELLKGDFAVEVNVTLDGLYSSGGILFRGSATSDFDGVAGYAVMVRDKRIYLYEITGSKYSGMVLNELSSDVIERAGTGKEFRLRLEREGNTFRAYYLDDMDGVEPWPEIEYVCNMYRGIGIGVIDNGFGASFSDLTVTEYTAPESSGNEYKNPVFSTLQGADPYVLSYDGKYYCYSTSAPLGYYVYVSDDMVNWTNEGLCIEEAWGIKKEGWYWAPEVIEHNGKFYMMMSVDERIGFAVADSPLGPFIPEETWIFTSTIDGHVFIDDDGQAYLYYVSWKNGVYGIYGCELEDDIVTVREGTEKLLLRPEDSWEKREGHVTEGPFILKHNDLYYLTYSGTGYESHDYAVGYAISDSPLGEYERYEANPILTKTSQSFGPGHHSFTTSKGGELFMVYHIHKSESTVHPRMICIDRARFAPTESGVDRIEVFGPTHTKQE